jgi:hypothetical protein
MRCVSSNGGEPVSRTDQCERWRVHSKSHFAMPLPREGFHVATEHKKYFQWQTRNKMN